MYRDTVFSEMMIPSFVNSAWIRGAPQPSCAIGRIRRQISASLRGTLLLAGIENDSGDTGRRSLVGASVFHLNALLTQGRPRRPPNEQTFFALATAAYGAISVFVADVDGDGDTDVLSASFNDGKIAWYENDLPFFGDGFETGDTSAWSSTVP